MSEPRTPYNAIPDRLHLRLSLTPDCKVELILDGKITREAVDRLKQFLDLAVPEKPEEESQ